MNAFDIRVLARPYLMTLYIIFSIHVNFPVTSRCVLKATVHRKKLLIEKITMSRNAKYFKSLKRIKVKSSDIRAL